MLVRPPTNVTLWTASMTSCLDVNLFRWNSIVEFLANLTAPTRTRPESTSICSTTAVSSSITRGNRSMRMLSDASMTRITSARPEHATQFSKISPVRRLTVDSSQLTSALTSKSRETRTKPFRISGQLPAVVVNGEGDSF